MIEIGSLSRLSQILWTVVVILIQLRLFSSRDLNKTVHWLDKCWQAGFSFSGLGELN